MCGIGFFGPFLKPKEEKEIVLQLLTELSVRGRDGFGFIVIHPKNGVIYHYCDFDLDTVKTQLENLKIPKGSYILLHTRARPISESIHENEQSKELLQPIIKENIVVAFNGIIENDKEFKCGELQWVDTFAICNHHKTYNDRMLKGSYSYIYVDLNNPNEVHIIKGNQPLYVYENPKTTQIIASSIPISPNNFYKINLAISEELQIKICENQKYIYKEYQCEKFINSISIENSSPTPNPDMKTAVILSSGGLDSCVVACELAKECNNLHLLNFDYGQPAAKQEWNATLRLHKHLKQKYPNKIIQVIQLKVPFVNELAKCSSIFNDVPKGISATETLSRWIPARNLIFLSIAVGYAESVGAGLIGYGGNLEEACVFPDNTTEAIEKLNNAIKWFISKPYIKIVNPIANDMKIDIVKKALEYYVYDISWSCDLNGEKECGQCEGCILKRKALEII